MEKNSELRKQAYEAIDGHWSLSALITFVYMLFNIGISCVPKIGSPLQILLLPMSWAYTIIFLRLIRKEEIRFSQIFDGFTNEYLRYLGTLLLQGIYIILWTLLLVVPGVMKACSYSMTYYILKDEPLSYNRAIEKSMLMMEGYKMKFFLMNLYFIGWGILCLLTLGIGFFWLGPYVTTCNAAFYEDVKADFEAKMQTANTAAAE